MVHISIICPEKWNLNNNQGIILIVSISKTAEV